MSAELEDIHEECGIFGVWGHPDAARLTYFGLHALQHRGQEGAGIVSNDHGHLIGHRGLGLLTQVFGDEREIGRLTGDKAIGHVRYATAGSGTTDNIQPFIFRFHDGDVALGHNGNLTNCVSLRRRLEDEGSKIGLATVYRQLNALADAGAADTIRLDGQQLFRLCGDDGHHHHLVCRRQNRGNRPAQRGLAAQSGRRPRLHR